MAGRERHEQINQMFRKVKRSEAFDTATDKAKEVIDLGVEKAKDVVDRRGNGSSESDSALAGTTHDPFPPTTTPLP